MISAGSPIDTAETSRNIIYLLGAFTAGYGFYYLYNDSTQSKTNYVNYNLDDVNDWYANAVDFDKFSLLGYSDGWIHSIDKSNMENLRSGNFEELLKVYNSFVQASDYPLRDSIIINSYTLLPEKYHYSFYKATGSQYDIYLNNFPNYLDGFVELLSYAKAIQKTNINDKDKYLSKAAEKTYQLLKDSKDTSNINKWMKVFGYLKNSDVVDYKQKLKLIAENLEQERTVILNKKIIEKWDWKPKIPLSARLDSLRNVLINNFIIPLNNTYSYADSLGELYSLQTPKREYYVDERLFVCDKDDMNSYCFPLIFLNAIVFNRDISKGKVNGAITLFSFKDVTKNIYCIDYSNLEPIYIDYDLGFEHQRWSRNGKAFKYQNSTKRFNSLIRKIRLTKSELLKYSYDFYLECAINNFSDEELDTYMFRETVKEYLLWFTDVHTNKLVNINIRKIFRELQISYKLAWVEKMNTNHVYFDEFSKQLEGELLAELEGYNPNYKVGRTKSFFELQESDVVLYFDKGTSELQNDYGSIFWKSLSSQFRTKFNSLLKIKISNYQKYRKEYLNTIVIGEYWNEGYIEKFNKNRSKVQIRKNREYGTDQLIWVDFK